VNNKILPFQADGPLFRGCTISILQVAPEEYREELDGLGQDMCFWLMAVAMEDRMRRPLNDVYAELEQWADVCHPSVVLYATILNPESPWGLLYRWHGKGRFPQFVIWRSNLYTRNADGSLSFEESMGRQAS